MYCTTAVSPSCARIDSASARDRPASCGTDTGATEVEVVVVVGVGLVEVPSDDWTNHTTAVTTPINTAATVRATPTTTGQDLPESVGAGAIDVIDVIDPVAAVEVTVGAVPDTPGCGGQVDEPCSDEYPKLCPDAPTPEGG